MRKKKAVFLGGTCNGSTWREELIPMLEEVGVSYFNPVVDNWDEEAKLEEIKQREECEYVLYVFTKEMKGLYSIAEAVDDSNKRKGECLFYISDEMRELYNGSFNDIEKLLVSNGATACHSLEEVARTLEYLIPTVHKNLFDRYEIVEVLEIEQLGNVKECSDICGKDYVAVCSGRCYFYYSRVIIERDGKTEEVASIAPRETWDEMVKLGKLSGAYIQE